MQQRFVKLGQRLFIGSFAFLIVLGTLALKLIPGAYKPGELSWADSLFTATSAVCVTGLSVVDVADFSWSGQLIQLILLQLGGIGIMSLSASILLLLGGGLSFSDSLLVSNLNEKFSLRGTESLTWTVIIYSFACEAVGFLVILPGCLGSDAPWWECVWNALFLAVSSFCNAGLAPFRDSLIGQNGLVRLGCGCMIVLGGLGVYVIYDLIQVFIKKRQRSLRVHSKIVLVTTAILLIGGAGLFLLFGFRNNNPISWDEALFMSATCRTAGFTCVEILNLPDVSLALCIVLMMIGGSPGSTAGGIKTSTFAVVVAAICNTLKGNQETLLFRRSIPYVVVLRAFTIIVLFSLLAGLGAVVLQLASPPTAKQWITRDVFEAVSALCTVGLSIGDTTKSQLLSGKLWLTAFMFIGRIGPFTFLLFLLDRETSGLLKHPEERVIIG